MVVCAHCGKKVPQGRKVCPYCGRAARDAPERNVPIVTAVIALAFAAVVILGAASAIAAWLRAGSGDAALHIDGIWVTEGPTYSDEHITYVFDGEAFTRIIETKVFGASEIDIDGIRDYQRQHNGAEVTAEALGDGTFLLRIMADGTFGLDGNSIVLVSGEGLLRVFSFYWEGEAVIINGERFRRRNA